ncbi:MAG: hypothetical protein methR_P2301 [Methyloprofundus sp.]|nr:MAG: hypothetical protein methR_P2301 [Methyloprofundus sp.]
MAAALRAGSIPPFSGTSMQAYFNFLLNWRKAIVSFWLILLGTIAIGALNLQFTTNYRVFFSAENPQLQSYLAMQDRFNKKDNLLFVVSVQQGHIFTKETLTAVNELTNAGWQLPNAMRIDSVTNFQYSEANADEISVHPLVQHIEQQSPATLQQLHAIAINEPQLLGRLINQQANVTGINVTFNIPVGQEISTIPQIAAQAQLLANNIQKKYPHITLHLTGIVMMDHALTEIPMQDMSKLVPLMLVLIALILYLFFQNGAAVFATLTLLMLCIGTTMGIAGWSGLLLSPPTAVVPIILMTVAVADSVHILVNFQNFLAAGYQQNKALFQSLSLNFSAIVLTSITTIIGFLGLNYSDVPPFQALGNLVALGTLVALLLSISFLPALILLLPQPKIIRPVKGQLLMQKTGRLVVKRPKSLLSLAIIISIFFISFLGQNRLNDQFINYFDDSVLFRQATDLTIAHLTGLYIIELEIDAQTPAGIFKPDKLVLIDNFTHWLRQQPEVLHVDTITDIIKRINKNLFADDPEQYKLPETPELAAQELLLFELSLPYGLDLQDKLNSKQSATRLSVSLGNLSSAQVLAFVTRTEYWFKQHNQTTAQLTASGVPLLFAHISERNISSMLLGTSLVLVSISLILLLVFKSIKIGLLSLIPNLAPAALAFGLWGLLVGQIGMTLAVVTCMTLGIIIDDTVHFLIKYLHFRRVEKQASALAITNTFSGVGTALLITSCALMAGFLALSFSAFVPNADMGLLTAITIMFALLADLFILPPILLLIKA